MIYIDLYYLQLSKPSTGTKNKGLSLGRSGLTHVNVFSDAESTSRKRP
jgi:hypothetical protein